MVVPTHTSTILPDATLTSVPHFDLLTATWTSDAGYGVFTVCDPLSSGALLSGNPPEGLSFLLSPAVVSLVAPPVRPAGRYDYIMKVSIRSRPTGRDS